MENQLNASMKANVENKKIQDENKSSLEKTSGSKGKCSGCGEQEKKIMEQRLKYQNLKT